MVDGVAAAWFEAPSLAAGGALAARVLDVADVDVRATGVRVRLRSDDGAAAVSAVARDLGLTADPAALQQVSVVIESGNPASVGEFWERVLGDLSIRVEHSTEVRPLRNRIHLDVVRPAEVVERLGLGAGSGPYGVCHADPDGNEVDLVPGDALGDGDATADWQVVFGAVACYRTDSAQQQGELVSAAAALADQAGFPLLIDARPGVVVLDSGKDRWEADFPELAADLQGAARDLGAHADPESARFVQLFIDAADVAAVRAFWVAALGYVEDPRSDVTDICDPRWLNPVLVFQELDAADAARRQQRNRIYVELAVPADVAEARVDAAVAAGGRVLDESPARWRVGDPEGNELVIAAA